MPYGKVIMLVMLAASLCAQQPTLRKENPNQKVIRDPVEYHAYVTALNIKDPGEKGAAMEAFARNYPNSVAYVDAMEQAMAAYQQAGNQAKVLATGRHILATRPHNVRAQAILVAIDRTIAANGGPEAQNAMKEACPYAIRGIEELARWQRPENMTEADFEKLLNQVTDIFYGAAGFCSLQNKDYNNARTYLEKAVKTDISNFQNVYQLSVADLEMEPLDSNGFWYCGKAINVAERQGNTQAVSNMAVYCKTKYNRYHGSEDGWDGIVSRSATENAPPAGSLVSRKPTPAEMAVQAVEKGGSLSFPDWEFILQYRDASPANRDAANKLWQAIQAQQKNGQTKIKLPSVKVVSSANDRVYGAVTDDNQRNNHPDLLVMMQKTISRPPAAGSMVEVIGVAQDYTLNPFLLTMVQGELPGIKPAASTQLSEADLEKLLHGGVTPKRATELVKQKGVSFVLDDATEARLRKAGATDELLLAIATVKKQ